jgi:hypothetical protein
VLRAQAAEGALTVSATIDEARFKHGDELHLTLSEGGRVILEGTYNPKGATLNRPLDSGEAHAMTIDPPEAHDEE